MDINTLGIDIAKNIFDNLSFFSLADGYFLRNNEGNP